MHAFDLAGILQFLRAAEALKTAHRSGWTSAGEAESVAEHTWRLCLMALVLQPAFPEVDLARLLKICIVHDLGEAINGDVPAPEQARQGASKAADERRDLLTLLEPLPAALRAEITSLWDEYDAAQSSEARLAKALDKLETILQHTQGQNPAEFDYDFNLAYGRAYTVDHPVLSAMRALLDAETERRAREAHRRSLMKGGKGGRPRRATNGGAKSGASGRKSGKSPNASRSTAPKKGEPRKPFGGRSSSGEQQ